MTFDPFDGGGWGDAFMMWWSDYWWQVGSWMVAIGVVATLWII